MTRLSSEDAEMAHEKKIAHLTFIQGIITRMGNNSFLLKGWTVTLVAALFALAAKDSNQNFILIAYFPILVFWMLDGYFLYQERLFRDLYNGVANDRISSEQFEINPASLMSDAGKWQPAFLWPRAALSKTLLVFYMAMMGVTLFVMCFLLR